MADMGKLFSGSEVNRMVPSFDGRGDVTVWLKKVKLVAKLRGITDLHAVIPLYLDGPAFALYEELPEDAKDKVDRIENALLSAFAMNKFQAYEALQRRKWKGEAETVDVYLSDIRKLAKLAGINDEEMIRCAFVVGFPAEISAQLRSSDRSMTCDLNELLERARMLIVRVEPDVSEMCAAARVIGRGQNYTKNQSYQSGQNYQRGQNHQGSQNKQIQAQHNIECYICKGPHLAKWCPKRSQPAGPETRTCFKCGEVGHLARVCHNNIQGNEEGKSYAPPAFQ